MENPDGASTSFDTETLEDCIATNQVRGTSTFHFDFETRSCKTGELNTNGDQDQQPMELRHRYLIGGYTDIPWTSPQETSEGHIDCPDQEGFGVEVSSNRKTKEFGAPSALGSAYRAHR